MKKILLIICLLCIVSCKSTSKEEVISYDEEPSYSVLDTIENGDDFVVPFNTTIKLETLRASDMEELNPIFQEEMKKYSKYFDGANFYTTSGYLFLPKRDEISIMTHITTVTMPQNTYMSMAGRPNSALTETVPCSGGSIP